MDFEIENRGNSRKKWFQKAIIFQLPFLMDLGSILEGLGGGFGRLWGAFCRPKNRNFAQKDSFKLNLDF